MISFDIILKILPKVLSGKSNENSVLKKEIVITKKLTEIITHQMPQTRRVYSLRPSEALSAVLPYCPSAC